MSLREGTLLERRIHELLVHADETAKFLRPWLETPGSDDYDNFWNGILGFFTGLEHLLKTLLYSLDDTLSELEDAAEGKYEGNKQRKRQPVLGGIVQDVYDRTRYV